MTPYDMLFGDQPLDEVLVAADFPAGSQLDVARSRMWEGKSQETAAIAAGGGEPWASLLVAQARITAGVGAQPQLRAVAENAFNEARARLWAWTALRKLGEIPARVHAQEVLGCVVEVPVDDGLDVLAAYADGSVRYLGHADQLIVWEVEPEESPKPAVIDVLTEAFPLLSIPPVPRDLAAEPPAEGTVRLTGLSANGVHRVDAPMSDIEKGGKYEPLFAAAIRLLVQVTQI